MFECGGWLNWMYTLTVTVSKVAFVDFSMFLMLKQWFKYILRPNKSNLMHEMRKCTLVTLDASIFCALLYTGYNNFELNKRISLRWIASKWIWFNRTMIRDHKAHRVKMIRDFRRIMPHLQHHIAVKVRRPKWSAALNHSNAYQWIG